MLGKSMFGKKFIDIRDACTFAQAIVDTVREPIVVLDRDLRVVAANRSFYRTFKVNPDDIQGRMFCELGNGEWNIPKLRLLLEKIIPEHGAMENYKVEHDFSGIVRRTMLLNAREVFYEAGPHTNILLSIEDVSRQSILEREMDKLLRQKDVLLDEMQHRVANSLQIIASIILLKAKAVDSQETRLHLQDTHKRVMSIAAVQQYLQASLTTGTIELGPYLSKLCAALSQSIISDNRSISLKVCGEGGSATCRDAVSLGLIVTELVINALKHAFPEDTGEGQVTITYDVAGTNWKLSVADNGIGRPDGIFAQAKTGLGTGIINALAHQLGAQVEVASGPLGTTVSISHAIFEKKVSLVASRRANLGNGRTRTSSQPRFGSH
jgi:two-component sensor histidine kinase